MDELIFHKIENKVYPEKQMHYSYFIADRRFAEDNLEIRPLTPGHFIYALIRNYSRMIYWGFLRLLYKGKFIDKPMNEMFSWEYFRFCWWKSLKYNR